MSQKLIIFAQVFDYIIEYNDKINTSMHNNAFYNFLPSSDAWSFGLTENAEMLSSSLLLLSPIRDYDISNSVHPDLAIAWEGSDWEKDGKIFKYGKQKFWIRDNAYFMKHTENGSYFVDNQIHKLSARDFAFGEQIKELVDPLRHSEYLDHYELNETENSITYYFKVNPNLSWFIFNSDFEVLNPLPEFYLNKTLSYYNESNQQYTYGTLHELANAGIDILQSDEFQDYQYSPVSAGPFAIKSIEENGKLNFVQRDDYWYPNEWDSPNLDFIVHVEGKVDPFYFTYNKTESNHYQKPTEFGIKYYSLVPQTDKYKAIGLYSEKLDMFEKGDIDYVKVVFNRPSVGELQMMDKILNNPRFSYIKSTTQAGPVTMMFNLENEYLKKYNIRRAIAHAINKDEMNEISGNLFVKSESPVYNYQKAFYKDTWKIEYDYNTARDLFRGEGLWAAETNEEIRPSTSPSITIPLGVGSMEYLGLSIMVLSSLVLMKNKKYKLKSR